MCINLCILKLDMAPMSRVLEDTVKCKLLATPVKVQVNQFPEAKTKRKVNTKCIHN